MKLATRLLIAGLTLAGSGCTKRVLPAQGQLLVLLSSDMQVPESFDSLIVKVERESTVVRRVYVTNEVARLKWKEQLTGGSAVDTDCKPETADDPAINLALPTSLSLLSTKKEASEATLTVTACKSGVRLFSTKLAVTFPGEGNTQMLRFPIRWLCADKGESYVVGCYSCDSSRCYGLTTHADDSLSRPCAVKACEVGTPDAESDPPYPTLDYEQEQFARYHHDSANTSDCFDVYGCFGAITDFDSPNARSHKVTVDWKIRTSDDTSPPSQCIAKLGPSDTNSSKLNLALVLPYGTQGICTSTHCLVPLEANSKFGWRIDPNDPTSLQLPDAVCHMLDSGQILSVRATNQCLVRTSDLPICGTDGLPASSDNGQGTYGELLVDGPFIRYRLDETTPVNAFVDDRRGNDLSPVGPDSNVRTDDAVHGVVGWARTFDSQNYAKSNGPLAWTDSYSIVLWLTLTEAAFKTPLDRNTFPVLSSISKDCEHGFRLSLLRCDNASPDHKGVVQLAFARPVGALQDGQCNLEWHYAEFARESFGGGYFTPWKSGDFSQIAITSERKKVPVIYIDGREVDVQNVSCSTNLALTSQHDDSYLYLGSNAPQSGTAEPRTGSLEFDEVNFFDRTLTEPEIRWLYVNTSTRLGPGGRHWGAWATQGGQANLVESLTPPAREVVALINDVAFSSAGLTALLGRDSGDGLVDLTSSTELTAYDEAVLWAKLPENDPFQFTLSAQHGLRQCTWQLKAGKAPYHVINLQQPSWCVDPNCGFNLSSVERVSVAAGWKEYKSSPYEITVSALDFRKRLTNSDEGNSVTSTSRSGGVQGPGDFCWRAISFFPDWLGRLAYSNNARVLSLDVLRHAKGSTTNYVELAADLPANNRSHEPRDFRSCPVVKVCGSAGATNQSVSVALTNDRGQTWSWPVFSYENGCYNVRLDAGGLGWPESGGAAQLPSPCCHEVVASSAVRMSLHVTDNIQVTNVDCCNASGLECRAVDLSWPLPTNTSDRFATEAQLCPDRACQ